MNPSMKSLEKPSMYLLELSPTTSICRRCYKIKGKHPLVSLAFVGRSWGIRVGDVQLRSRCGT